MVPEVGVKLVAEPHKLYRFGALSEFDTRRVTHEGCFAGGLNFGATDCNADVGSGLLGSD